MLVQTFINNYPFSELFGANFNPAKIDLGLESFHNLVLDGFWYGGWIGGALVILGLVMLAVMAFKNRSYIGIVVMLSIMAGLLIAAPPFSNQFAFALLLPLFLAYLRSVRIPNEVDV